MLEQFKNNTWAAIDWTLENSGSLTIREIVYRFFKTPHEYLGILADEVGSKSARKLLARHTNRFRVEEYPDYFRKANVNYYFAKQKTPPDSFANVPHDGLVQAVFFALDKAYGEKLTQWMTKPELISFKVLMKGRIRTQEPDALAIIGDRHVYIELELTQKVRYRISNILKRYKVALQHGKIPADAYVLYITDTEGLAKTMHRAAIKLRIPANVRVCTMERFMRDPKGDIYFHGGLPIEAWDKQLVGA